MLKIAALLLFIAAAVRVYCFYKSNGVTLHASNLMKFAAFKAFFVYPFGYIFFRIIRLKFDRPGETVYDRFAFTMTIGYVISAYVCYLINCTSVKWLFPVLSSVLFVFLLLDGVTRRGDWTGRWKRNFAGIWTELDTVACLLVTLLMYRDIINGCYLTNKVVGDVLYHQFMSDNNFHMGMIYEAFRHIPFEQYPLMAGKPMFQYHFMGSFLSWMAANYAHADVMNVFHLYHPAFNKALGAIMLLCLCRRLGGRKEYSYIGFILLFFMGLIPYDVIRFLRLSNPSIYYVFEMNMDFPVTVSMPILYSIFYLFLARTDGDKKPSWIAAGLLAGSLLLFKANFMMLAFPSLMATACISLLRSEDRKAAFACIVSGLACFIVGFAILSQYMPEANGVKLQFGAYANYLYLKYFCFAEPGLRLLNKLPKPVLWVMSASVFPLLNNCGVIIPPALVFYASNLKNFFRDHIKVFSLFLYLTIVFAYLFVTSGDYYLNIPKNLPTFVYTSSVIPAICGLRIIVDRINASGVLKGGARKAVAAVVIVLCVLSVGLSTYKAMKPRGSYNFHVRRSRIEAWEWLREKTPLDSVVISNRHVRTAENLFGGRRTVLEADWSSWKFPDDFKERITDMRVLFATEDVDIAKKVLKKYKVTHVIAMGGQKFKFSIDGVLVQRFRSGPVTVYEVVINRR